MLGFELDVGDGLAELYKVFLGDVFQLDPVGLIFFFLREHNLARA